MKKQILTLGFVLFSFMLPLKASAEKVDKIYTFGDSLSDVGNIYNASIKLTNTAYPPSPPYYKGRFSNGPVWVEYLGQQLKLTPTPYTTLPPGSSTAPNGINYAFGGSSAGDNNVIFPTAPFPGVLGQVKLFALSLTQSKHSADPNALYIVWGGANDYLFGKVSDPQVPLNNLSIAVTLLAKAGAKKIVVPNLPDLGKLPATRNTQFSNQLTALTNSHNARLAQNLKALHQIFPSVKIVVLDVNTLFNTAIKYPGVFGFTNVTDACLTTIVCEKPNQYLFWDGYHPTTAAHKLLEDLAYVVLKTKFRSTQAMQPPENRITQVLDNIEISSRPLKGVATPVELTRR